MSDITGDAFVVYAADKIEDAIEHVGKTSSQMQVGKGIAIKDETGVTKSGASTTAKEFIGVVKAVSGEAQVGFGTARMINDVVTGADPTVAPYFTGNVTVPAGKALTIERNCITYVLADGDIEAGDLIGCAADGKFKAVDTVAEAVGRAYGAPDANDVVRVYIRAI